MEIFGKSKVIKESKLFDSFDYLIFLMYTSKIIKESKESNLSF